MKETNIHKEYSKYITSLKVTSWDKTHKEYMIDSDLPVYNFDKVMKKYCSLYHPSAIPSSNDALVYLEDNLFYFIEFKNGNIYSKTIEIRAKLVASLLVFLDIEKKDLEFSRRNINYILVYNELETLEEDKTITNRKINNSSSRNQITEAFSEMAKSKFVKFGLERLEKIYLKGVFTYTVEEFNKKHPDLVFKEG